MTDEYSSTIENTEEESLQNSEGKQDHTPEQVDELAEMKDQWLRALAESENIRRRGQRDKEEAIRYGAVSFARDIVSIVDNLRRAAEVCAAEDRSTLPQSVQSLMTGVDMIVSEIDTALKKHHVTRISPLHEPFNAHFHQAMCEIENADHPAGTVVHIMQDGYSLHDRLLRPALVGVSKLPASSQ